MEKPNAEKEQDQAEFMGQGVPHLYASSIKQLESPPAKWDIR